VTRRHAGTWTVLAGVRWCVLTLASVGTAAAQDSVRIAPLTVPEGSRTVEQRMPGGANGIVIAESFDGLGDGFCGPQQWIRDAFRLPGCTGAMTRHSR
jgi:hypothetical protein